MAYKLLIIIVLIILAILFVSSVLVYIPSKKGEPARLGFVWEKPTPSPCTGEISVSSTPSGNKCDLTAEVRLRNCEEKRWYVFKGTECGGILVCDGDVRVPDSRWKCEWEDDRGSYTLSLCADLDKKASITVTC